MGKNPDCRALVLFGFSHLQLLSVCFYDHAYFRGQFVVRWLLHVIPDAFTKKEVSNFNHSEDIKGSQNFKVGHVT